MKIFTQFVAVEKLYRLLLMLTYHNSVVKTMNENATTNVHCIAHKTEEANISLSKLNLSWPILLIKQQS